MLPVEGILTLDGTDMPAGTEVFSGLNEGAGNIVVGNGREFDGHIFTGGALHADGAVGDDQIAAHDLEIDAAGGADADKGANAGLVAFLHADGGRGAAHTGGHDHDRLAVHLTQPCGILTVLAVEMRLIQKLRDLFYPAGITRQNNIFGAVGVIKAYMIHFLHVIFPPFWVNIIFRSSLPSGAAWYPTASAKDRHNRCGDTQSA